MGKWRTDRKVGRSWRASRRAQGLTGRLGRAQGSGSEDLKMPSGIWLLPLARRPCGVKPDGGVRACGA